MRVILEEEYGTRSNLDLLNSLFALWNLADLAKNGSPATLYVLKSTLKHLSAKRFCQNILVGLSPVPIPQLLNADLSKLLI